MNNINNIIGNILGEKATIKKATAPAVVETANTQEAEQVKETPTKTNIFTLANLEAMRKKIEEGINIEEYKTAFFAAVDNKEPIILEIDKSYNMADIKKRVYHHSGDKKSDLVTQLYEGLLMGFKVSDGLLTYSPYEGFVHDGKYNKNAFVDALTAEIEKTTQEDIDKNAAEKAAKRDAMKKTFTNPETLEEFKIFIQTKGKAALNPEQLRKYEEIAADKILEEKKAEEAKRAIVQAVNIECDMKIYKTTHSVKNIDLWVIKLSERVEKEVYTDLNNKAKKLGGYYSSYARNGAIPGFTFTDEEAANKFLALKEGDQVTERHDQKREERASNAINKFYEMAQRMQELGFEEYSKERKENTGRRARMAANAQENAERTIYWGKVLNKIGEKLEAKELKYLALISSFSQVLELKDVLNDGFNKRNKDNKITGDERRSEIKNYEENLNFVSVPLPSVNKENFSRVCNALLTRPGQMLRAKKFLKVVNASKSEYMITFSAYALEDLKSLVSAHKGWESDYIKEEILSYERVKRMGLDKIEILKMALREFIPCLNVDALTETQKEEKEIKGIERKFIGSKIDGFFPTPENLVGEMVAFADIQENDTILEPSAGLGHIADEIKEQNPNNILDCCEINFSLIDALNTKGHNIIESDFLHLNKGYDKIIMNPPFENNQDVKHILHAFNNCLNDGGRIVAIMSAVPFNRSGKIETDFRSWINEVGAKCEDLPEGSFKDAFRSTGVNTKIVIIDKPIKAGGGRSTPGNVQMSIF
jgi:phospholipid N-methyltransferase